MTGATVLWVWIAVFFAIPLVVLSLYIGCKAINEDLPNWKGMLATFVIILFSACGCAFSGWQCQKCYDVNFAVAMKNINYTRSTEVNTNIEMNYQDGAKENK